MLYNKTIWVNGTAPARNAVNLNKQEQGIYAGSLATTALAIAVVGQAITITDDITTEKFTIEVPTLITGGAITINIGAGALPLYSDYALTEAAVEIEPGIYDIWDKTTAFFLAPKGGAKKGIYTIQSNTGVIATTQRVNVSGAGVVRSVFNTEVGVSYYSGHFIIDGVRYPTSDEYRIPATGGLINIGIEFKTSFQFFSDDQRLQCTYELAGIAKHSTIARPTQPVTLEYTVTGKGIVRASIGRYHSLEIDGTFLVGDAINGQLLDGQYIDVGYTTSLKYYVNIGNSPSRLLVYEIL